MISVPGGRHPGELLFILQAVGFQLPQLLHHMGHIHALDHGVDDLLAVFCHAVTGSDVGNVGSGGVVAVLAEAVTDGCALF